MKILISLLLMCAFVAGCGKDKDDGDKGKSVTAPPEAPPVPGVDPGATPSKPILPPSGGNDGGEASLACMVRELGSKRYYVGFGEDMSDATAIAVEFCKASQGASANCTAETSCEERITTESWHCNVINTRTSDKWDGKGRSKLEAFAQAYGVCIASQNADTTVCQPYANANCERK